ncbi:MAG TPA: hypothetical protein VGH66_15270 [Acidimicrobiales bacterium]|jgi:hypothetical protein
MPQPPNADSVALIGCDGVRAFSYCLNRAKYRVDGRHACGVHLAQLVKAALFMTPPGEFVKVESLSPNGSLMAPPSGD